MMAPQTLAACLAAIKANPARFYVYVLSRVDGTPFYVGKGQANRIADHECYAKNGARGHRLSIIRGIWKSGGLVGYTLVAHFENEADAFAEERRLIAVMGRRTHGGVLTNRTDGGDGISGLIITRSMRAKISAALKGRKKTPEHVAKVAAKRRGCVHDETARAKISAAVRRPESLARVGAARRGAKLTAETIAKMKLSKLGFRHSRTTKLKMSAAHLGKIVSQASKEKLR